MSNVKEKFLRNQIRINENSIEAHRVCLNGIYANNFTATHEAVVDGYLNKIETLYSIKENLEDELNKEILNKQPRGKQ